MEKLIVNLKDKIIVYPTLEPLNITPSTISQSFQPEEGYAYEKVNVSAVNSSIDNNIRPENIKKDVEILGVVGNVEEGIPPIVQNETLIFKKNASVNEGVLNL